MDGEVALVTGAGSGIGRAVARRLSERGAHVVALDLSESVQDAATELEGNGVQAVAVVGSVTDEDVLQRAVVTAMESWGSLDTVAACAGVEVVGDAPNLRIEDWQRALDVNLTGTFVTARTTIPALIETGGGTFTAIGSDAGVRGAQGYAAYCAAKHGIVGLVRCLALDHGPQGVRSNVVCPSFVETPMMHRLLGDDPAAADFYRRIVPLGRFSQPEEVADAVAHLSSPQASYVNGLIYELDGGAGAGYFEPPADASHP